MVDYGKLYPASIGQSEIFACFLIPIFWQGYYIITSKL